MATNRANRVVLDSSLSTKHLDGNLKRLSVRGGVATISQHGASFILNTGSIMVLARLLTPQDFGLVAMVTAVTGFASIFRDMGLSYATIQRQGITHAQVSTLFWLNTLMGLVLTLIVGAFAPAAAWFYRRPELTPVMMALAPTFLLSGLTVQHNAILSRQMRFPILAIIALSATTAGVLVAIVAALYGYRYWALVFQALAIAVVTAIGAWIASGWRPGLPRRNLGTREMISYGMNVTGFDIVNYFARNLDNVLIGRFSGSFALGNYSRAYQLMMLPISLIRSPINSVAMPALSRLHDSPKRYRSYYNTLLSLIAFSSMPLVVFGYVCSEELVHIFLGRQWDSAITLFRILAFAAFIQPVSGTIGLLLMSSGQGKELFRWGIFNALVTSIAFALGIRWAAVGVAAVYVITNYIVLYPTLWYACLRTPVRVADFFYAISRPVVTSLLMGGVISILRTRLVNQHDLAVVLVCLASGFLAYLCLWSVTPRGISELRSYAGYGRQIIVQRRR